MTFTIFSKSPFFLSLTWMLTVFMSIGLSACELIGSGNDGEISRSGTVLIANGGNFGDQNGTITSFDPQTGVVDQHAPMSGFLQGLVANDGKIYALLNTFSIGRVDVLEAETLSPIDQIADVTAPRFMVFGSDLAYVSNFVFGSNGHVSVISLSTNAVQNTIPVGENPEGLLLDGAFLFVANNGSLGDGNTVTVIDTKTDNTVNRTVPCDGPRDILGGGNDGIIIICSGKTVYNADFSEVLERTHGAILFFDSSMDMLEDQINLNFQPLSTNGTAAGIFVASKNELYVIDGDANTITRINTESRAVTSQVQLSTAGSLTGISGIAYDERKNIIYVGRFPVSSGGPFPDFTTSGTIQIYSRTFELTESFLAGVAISQILIKN